jgi:hypothetical protein
MYIKRFKGAVFYDYSLGKNVFIPNGSGSYIKEDRIFRSLGLELTSDFHLVHILFPFEMGVRFSYPLDDAKPKLEILYSIDISEL